LVRLNNLMTADLDGVDPLIVKLNQLGSSQLSIEAEEWLDLPTPWLHLLFLLSTHFDL